MQKLDQVNYKNKLNESVGIVKEKKIGNIHYFDDNKIQRWYVIEESADKNILAFANTPEELNTKLESLTLSNKSDLEVVLKYRQVNKIQESSNKDRLFYLDTLYGVKEHALRKTLKENKNVPFLEKTYNEVMEELDAYPTAPAPLSGQQPGIPVATQGAPSGPIIGAMGNEMDFILSDLFDDVLSGIKSLRTNSYAGDKDKELMVHYFYENLYEMRQKIIDALKERIQEQMGQPVVGGVGNQNQGGMNQTPASSPTGDPVQQQLQTPQPKV